MDAKQIRAILEEHSDLEGHVGFKTLNGTYYEGYYYVDEDEDIIHFASGGPFGGWEQDFRFEEIDMNFLIPPMSEWPKPTSAESD